MTVEADALRISRMPKDEQAKLLALVNSLLATPPSEEDSVDWYVVHAMNLEFRRRGLSEVPYPVLRAQRFYPKFREGSAILAQYVRGSLGAESPRERTRAIQTLVRMLCRRMKRERVPLSPSSIAHHLKRIPDVVDDQFPGYRESGLLRFIITHQKAGG